MKKILLLAGIITLNLSCNLIPDKGQTAIEICQQTKADLQNKYGVTPNVTWLDVADLFAKKKPDQKYSWHARATKEPNVFRVSFADDNNWGLSWEVDIA